MNRGDKRLPNDILPILPWLPLHLYIVACSAPNARVHCKFSVYTCFTPTTFRVNLISKTSVEWDWSTGPLVHPTSFPRPQIGESQVLCGPGPATIMLWLYFHTLHFHMYTLHMNIFSHCKCVHPDLLFVIISTDWHSVWLVSYNAALACYIKLKKLFEMYKKIRLKFSLKRRQS